MASTISSTPASSSSSSSLPSKASSAPLTTVHQKNLYSLPKLDAPHGVTAQAHTLPTGQTIKLLSMRGGSSKEGCKDVHLFYVLKGEAIIKGKKQRASGGDSNRVGGEEVDKVEREEEETRVRAGHLIYIPPQHSTTVPSSCEEVQVLVLNDLFSLTTLNQQNKTVCIDMLNPASASERRQMNKFSITTFTLAPSIALSIGKFLPGWDWEKDVKPIAKTTWCEHTHVLFALQGRMTCDLPNGEHYVMQKGDFIMIPPQHTGHVEGNEEALCLDFGSFATYAKEK